MKINMKDFGVKEVSEAMRILKKTEGKLTIETSRGCLEIEKGAIGRHVNFLFQKPDIETEWIGRIEGDDGRFLDSIPDGVIVIEDGNVSVENGITLQFDFIETEHEYLRHLETSRIMELSGTAIQKLKKSRSSEKHRSISGVYIDGEKGSAVATDSRILTVFSTSDAGTGELIIPKWAVDSIPKWAKHVEIRRYSRIFILSGYGDYVKFNIVFSALDRSYPAWERIHAVEEHEIHVRHSDFAKAVKSCKKAAKLAGHEFIRIMAEGDSLVFGIRREDDPLLNDEIARIETLKNTNGSMETAIDVKYLKLISDQHTGTLRIIGELKYNTVVKFECYSDKITSMQVGDYPDYTLVMAASEDV